MGSFEDLPTETRILVLQHLSSIDLRSFLLSQARHQPTSLPPSSYRRDCRCTKQEMWSSAAVRALRSSLFRVFARASNAELWRTISH